MCCGLKKAFTLIEITVAISLVLILSSSSAFIYKHYIRQSKDRIITSHSEQIFEAVLCIYEERENNMDVRDLVQGVKDLTNYDISITYINMDDKLLDLMFYCEGKDYIIKIDVKKSSFTVIDMLGDRVIYED